ncbi:MAG: hypothetical protein M3N53_14260 [Actinomycetota bacterium]|nr:hypothetical protein [Actinomycetota bacterium]
MLRELEVDSGVVVSDLEAGVGTLVRMSPGVADLAIVVAEPTVRSIETARRAGVIAANRADVVVVANRITSESDAEMIRSQLGDYEIFVVPDDPAISRADREGLAPIDFAPDSPGVRAIADLAHRIVDVEET